MKFDDSKLDAIAKYSKSRPVLKAYLFGSYVRGQADEKSDVDILVELDYSQRIGLEFIQMQLDLEAILNTKIDLVSSNSISKHIQSLIDKEKRLIYAR